MSIDHSRTTPPAARTSKRSTAVLTGPTPVAPAFEAPGTVIPSSVIPLPTTEPAASAPPVAAPEAPAAPKDRFEGWVRSRPRALLDEIVMIDIAACPVALVDEAQALRVIGEAASRPHPVPLAVASINLDHVHHFGNGRRTLGGQPLGGRRRVEWLSLIDGAPIARQVQRFTGTDTPRLAGSDLISGVLAEAAERRLSVAILGGAAELTPVLRERLAERWPDIVFCGHWTPARSDLAADSARIAAEIRSSGADIVIVCLGKPRQEEWIDSYGRATGAGVLLAFGAVVDFLAGRVSRAPSWISAAGGEWMWRLMLEPRRLARRYLVEGPPAYMAVRRSPAPLRA
jgi:exopolysaccharide biosynthesis WecB/TagA/CpsF family protein